VLEPTDAAGLSPFPGTSVLGQQGKQREPPQAATTVLWRCDAARAMRADSSPILTARAGAFVLDMTSSSLSRADLLLGVADPFACLMRDPGSQRANLPSKRERSRRKGLLMA